MMATIGGWPMLVLGRPLCLVVACGWHKNDDDGKVVLVAWRSSLMLGGS